jgi:hypothetical protein
MNGSTKIEWNGAKSRETDDLIDYNMFGDSDNASASKYRQEADENGASLRP